MDKFGERKSTKGLPLEPQCHGYESTEPSSYLGMAGFLRNGWRKKVMMSIQCST